MEDLEARLCGWRRRGRRVAVAVARVRDQAAQRRRRRRSSSSLRRRREEREAHAPLVRVSEMQLGREVRSGLRDRVLKLVGGDGLTFGDPLCNGLAVGAEEQALPRRHRVVQAG